MGDKMLTVRVSSAELDKLNALARKTMRTRSDLVRLLVAQAEASATPDVTLASVERQDEKEAGDARE